MKFSSLSALAMVLLAILPTAKAPAQDYPIMTGWGPPAASVPTVAPTSGDVAVCTQTDAAGKVIRQWTEPAAIVRKAHGWTAATPAVQCTGCTDCQCPAGNCAAGKCPAATANGAAYTGASVQCIGAQCPNAGKTYPMSAATQWRGRTYTQMPVKLAGSGCQNGTCPGR